MTALDVAVTLPCERRDHPVKHVETDPAVWDVRTHCPGCAQAGHYLLCESGVTLGCGACGLSGPWDAFITSCLRIPEALRGAA